MLAMHLALLLAVAGCGRGDSQSPTSANDAGGAYPTEGGQQNSSTPKSQSDPQHPVVEIDTSLGKITLRLDADKAPATVDNFLAYIKANQYEQTIVHQVYKGQGFLAGGYGLDLVERRVRTPIFNEARNGSKNLRGTIGMVRSPDVTDSATCQFFINLVDNPVLDHRDNTPEGYGYCVFGEVVDGMDTVNAIGNVQVHDTPEFDQTPVQAVVVKSIRWLR